MGVDYSELGYNEMLERKIYNTDSTDSTSSAVPTTSGLTNSPMTSGEIAGALPTGSVPFSATGLAQFVDNEDMQTKNFVSGVAGSGWRIKGNGDVEFNSGTFMGALTAATIDIGGSDATSFHVDINGNMWLGAATLAASVFSVTNAGLVTAVSGLIAGWTISATTLANSTNIILDSSNKAISINSATWQAQGIQLQYNAGTPRAYIGDGGVTASDYYIMFDGTNISWNAVATSLSTVGLLTTTSALIGGWNVVDGYIYNLQSGTPTVAPNDGIVMASGSEGIIVYEDTAKRCEMGYLSAGVYGLKGYATNGTDVIFELSDTQQKIAGWYFDTTSLADNSTAANAKIYIDSGNTLIRAGATTGDYLTFDGGNLRIRSSNYVSGFAGAGFTLEPDLLEVGNIAARGLIRSSVMEYNNISVHSGSDMIAFGGDVLNADMTALDASVFTIKGTDTFAVNDVLRIKDGTNDEWLLVTGVAGAPTYTVTRDQAGAYGADANPAWKLGASVTNYGPSGSGLLYLTASDTNAPYLAVATHAGSPWSALTTRLRIGNLNGYLDYVADVYGFACGSSTGTNANITIEPTNGIRIRNGTTNVMTLDNAGNATFTGSITATTGFIGGWTINATSLTDTAGLVGMSSAVTVGDDIRFWAGNVTPGSAPFRVTEAGALVATSATITGAITATSGAIKGAFTVGDGSSSSGTITLSHFDTGGDTYIAGGTFTAAAWTAQNGFIIGIDDSDGDKFKAYFGDSTTGYQWDWNVTTANKLTINGKINGLDGFGGDGSDGALSVGAGVTTTLNLDQVYNYSSISVNATGTLAFTGSGGAYLNCSGNCAIAGTIELRNKITSTTQGGTIRDNLEGGTPMPTFTANVGGTGGAGGGSGGSNAGNGGTGGTSTTASGTPGVGGAGGTGAGTNGSDGSGGNSSVGGGGGGGGAAADEPNDGTNGSTTVTVDGGNGGAGANGTTLSGGGGGGGGGGYDTGNGGTGGTGGNYGGNNSAQGGKGGKGGASGANGGNGGAGGNSGASDDLIAGTIGGAGGQGYTNGGNGGIGGTGNPGGAGGAGGDGIYGTGGTGGTGGAGFNPVGDANGGNGGVGGAGRTGGTGGTGGADAAAGVGGTGGAGGAGKAGSTFLVMYVAGSMDLTGMTVNAQGGNGGNGGNGGITNGAGGSGGDGGDGADIVMVSLGTKTGTPTINNLGGAGGTGGSGVGTGSAGTSGDDGFDGVQVIAQIKQTL